VNNLLIETVDSEKLANLLQKECEKIKKSVPVIPLSP